MPYYNGCAIGLAFAITPESTLPYSLKVIEKSIQEDLKIEDKLDPTLSHWVDQGVFLLNTALTVEKDKPESHLKLWKSFTNTVIAHISFEVNPTWLLLGTKAVKYKKIIMFSDKVNYKIVERSHPAAVRYNIPFEGFVHQIPGIKWI